MKTPRQKQLDNSVRANARAGRSPREQLALLETRPGEAKRERTRLTAKLAPAKPVK